MAAADFSSARELVAWARSDIEEFDSVAKAHLGSDDAYLSFSEIDPDTGYITFKIRISPVPKVLRKLASHALWDMKHALDHAMHAAIWGVTGRDPGDVHFLICSHPNDVRGRLRQRDSKYPIELHGLLEGFEIYPTSDRYPGGNDEFVELSKMANTSKHSVALAANPRSVIRRMTGQGFAGGRMLPEGWDGSKGELTLGTFPPDPNGKMNVELGGFIAFSEVERFKGHPAGEVLEAWAGAAENVIWQLEHEVALIITNRGGLPLHRLPLAHWVREV